MSTECIPACSLVVVRPESETVSLFQAKQDPCMIFTKTVSPAAAARMQHGKHIRHLLSCRTLDLSLQLVVVNSLEPTSEKKGVHTTRRIAGLSGLRISEGLAMILFGPLPSTPRPRSFWVRASSCNMHQSHSKKAAWLHMEPVQASLTCLTIAADEAARFGATPSVLPTSLTGSAT